MGKALRWLSRQSIPDDENRRSLKQEAARQLDESLQRLQVDCIDLVQHHEIIGTKTRIECLTKKGRMLP